MICSEVVAPEVQTLSGKASIVYRAENFAEHLAHKAAKVINRVAKLANSQSSKTTTHRAEK